MRLILKCAIWVVLAIFSWVGMAFNAWLIVVFGGVVAWWILKGCGVL